MSDRAYVALVAALLCAIGLALWWARDARRALEDAQRACEATGGALVEQHGGGFACVLRAEVP